jgi:hypothetical protein
MRKLRESVTKQLDKVFNPRSVGVVGDKQALGVPQTVAPVIAKDCMQKSE